MEKIFDIENNLDQDDIHFETNDYSAPHVTTTPTTFVSPDLDVNNDFDGLDLLMNDKSKKINDVMSVKSEESNIFESDDNAQSDEDAGFTSKINSQNPPYSTFQTPQNNTYQSYQPNARDPSQEKKEKSELLYQFDRLEKKGFKLPRKFSMDSDLDEMRSEYDRLVKDREADNSVNFQRKMLVATITGIEFLNNKFDPFDVKLDGWSESINDNIGEYDEIFEELHHKYKSKSKMAPELRLLMSLAGSGFMFHLTNTMFKSNLPGFDQVMKQNPDLMKQFASATANTMAQNDNTGMAGMFGNMFKSSGSGAEPKKQTMQGPTNLDEILKNIENDDRLESMSSASESELSVMTDSRSIGGRKKGKKKTMNI